MIYISVGTRARNSKLENKAYFKNRRFCIRYSFYLDKNNV